MNNIALPLQIFSNVARNHRISPSFAIRLYTICLGPLSSA